MRERGAFPLAPITRPQYRWPSERDKAPKTCWNCGAKLLYGDVPTVRGAKTEEVCWVCSRLQCTLISDLTPREPTADEWRALPGNQPQRGRPRKLVIGGGAE